MEPRTNLVAEDGRIIATQIRERPCEGYSVRDNGLTEEEIAIVESGGGK